MEKATLLKIVIGLLKVTKFILKYSLLAILYFLAYVLFAENKDPSAKERETMEDYLRAHGRLPPISNW